MTCELTHPEHTQTFVVVLYTEYLEIIIWGNLTEKHTLTYRKIKKNDTLTRLFFTNTSHSQHCSGSKPRFNKKFVLFNIMFGVSVISILQSAKIQMIIFARRK